MNDINIALSLLFVSQYNINSRMNIGGVAKKIMIEVYNEFVKDGSMKAIEELLLDEKMSLVNECRAAGEVFTNETLIERSKILHVIRTINANT